MTKYYFTVGAWKEEENHKWPLEATVFITSCTSSAEALEGSSLEYCIYH